MRAQLFCRIASVAPVLRVMILGWILACLLGPVLPCSHAEADTTTLFAIQTGTFVPRDAAQRQFETLAARLPEDLRPLLRIEEGSRYFMVRLGLFPEFEQARSALNRVHPVVGDAFVLNAPEDPPPHLVYLFPQFPAPGLQYSIALGTFTEHADAARLLETLVSRLTDPRRSEVIATAGGYVPILGTFTILDDAWRALAVIRRLHADSRIVSLATLTTSPAQPARDSVREYPVSGDSGDPSGDQLPAGDTPAPSRDEQIAAIVGELGTLLADESYERAAALLEGAIARFPDSPELQAWHGSSLMTLGQHQEAHDAYVRAAELEPEVPEYRSAAGYSMIQVYRENVLEAIEEFGKALDIDPDNSQALEGLGTVYVSMGEHGQARQVEERLREIDPAAADRLLDLIEYGVEWKP